jgi:hypothetical protein
MAPTIADIMRGIENALKTIPGLRVGSDGSPDQINPPAAIVGIPPVPNYHQAMRRGTVELSPTVLILISAAVSRTGQMALAEYANPTGASSVVAAIEADKTLGGLPVQAVVRSFRPLGLEEVGEVNYFGGLFTLTVNVDYDDA